VSDRCWLVDEVGRLVDLETDSKLDIHFDEMLDRVTDWKKQADHDSSLLGNHLEYFKHLFCCFMITLVNCNDTCLITIFQELWILL